jgi:hypothetical protein
MGAQPAATLERGKRAATGCVYMDVEPRVPGCAKGGLVKPNLRDAVALAARGCRKAIR